MPVIIKLMNSQIEHIYYVALDRDLDKIKDQKANQVINLLMFMIDVSCPVAVEIEDVVVGLLAC